MQVQEPDDLQDIDVTRFVPQEVDYAGITIAAADRFTAKKTKAARERDGGWHFSTGIVLQYVPEGAMFSQSRTEQSQNIMVFVELVMLFIV